MPAWLSATGESAGFGRVSTARARAIGLTYRPLGATVADTLAWWRGQPETRRAKPAAGITPAREAEVFKAWHLHETERAG